MKEFRIQSRPSKRISPNDALTQALFAMSNKEFQATLGGKERTFREGGKTESKYWLSVLKEIAIEQPLDEFDRNILEACVSAQSAGHDCITLKGIWRGITGTTGKPTVALKKEISERIEKLASIRVTIDVSEAAKKKIYPADFKVRLKRSLLPCSVVEAVVNGQISDAVIQFDRESPLLTLAKARSHKDKQILSYDVALLDVPNQRNTPTTIKITNYIVRRVEVAKQHSNMTRTIRLDTLFKYCGLDADRRRKLEYRKTAEAVMKSLGDKGEIQSFEFVQEGGKFTKITFNFS